MINTWSAFYYGHYIDTTNLYLDFNEGGGELTGTLRVGDYTLTTFATEIARAMNAAGGQTYDVSVNRLTRKLTISTTSTFSILITSGTHSGSTALTLAGFTGADVSGTNTYTGNNGSGSSYVPQLKLQSYIAFDYNKSVIDSTTTVSSDGSTVQTVSNGDAYFMRCNIMYINDYNETSDILIGNASAVSETLTFLEYITQKRKIEFILDYTSGATFESCLLESTPENRIGTSFILKELINSGLVGYFETGVLTFRRITP